MSQWTEWSRCACAENSAKPSTRARSRTVVTEPLPSAEQCAELEETEECPCYTYSKEYLDWTRCDVQSEAECGTGGYCFLFLFCNL